MSGRLSQTTVVATGIHQLPVETPFAVGTVNTYLIEDDPLTLVDCGPNTATGLVQLEQMLAGAGYGVSDLELIFVTHQHLDHSGLAGVLAKRSGAELVCLDRLAPVLADWEGFSIASDEDARALMLRHGVEPHVADALASVASITRGFGASARADRTLSDGDILELRERRYEILHRPGHSATDTVLFDRASAQALLGDHLLKHVSPNALVSGQLTTHSARRAEPLLQYRHSLLKTRELEFELGLTGHGAPITDHRTLIDERIAAQDRRAEGFYRLLAEGPLSAHELATERWGRVAVTQAFLTLSEVLGHLGLLLAEERVVEVEEHSGDVIRFSQA
jgi:glyoxylase-like metal-dependent hydrolase (beta-lactamase superfamily II)